MSKKSLDRRSAQEYIVDRRNSGVEDQAIYTELVQKYYDKKAIALLIKGTATTENIRAYKVYNNILVGVLGLSIVIKLFMVISLALSSGKLWALVLVLIVPVFSGYFMYEIARYNGPIYRFCGWMAIAGFLQTVRDMSGVEDVLINAAFTGAGAGLAFFLDNKLFPDYSPRKLKKDSAGEYVL